FAPQDAKEANLHPGVNPFPFDPTKGPGYVWHCHILDHEDNDMMRPMKITTKDLPSLNSALPKAPGSPKSRSSTQASAMPARNHKGARATLARPLR
ncbi:MAG: multicopper oxidase domain-containing protein, partial [Candidatus Angelobacter sp.]